MKNIIILPTLSMKYQINIYESQQLYEYYYSS